MKKFFIFKVGETFKNTKEEFYDFEDWIKNNIYSKVEIEIVDILNNQKLPNFEDCLGVIITGSHSMVTDNLAWSLYTENWIKDSISKQIPILGICYGHQLICKALGGKVENNPNGKEIGTVKVYANKNISNDKLFKDAPLDFFVNVTHMQSIIILPENAISLAFNEHDKNQIVKFSNLVWGIQFHPEFNEKIMYQYIKEQEKRLIELEFNVDKLVNEILPTPYSHSILEKFVQIALKSEKE